VLGLEAGDEFGSDLVIRLADGRPERDRNARTVGAAPLHGRDRRFEDAGGGAAPAGMGDPDDAGRFVGEQHGAAVGGRDPDGAPPGARSPRARAGGRGCGPPGGATVTTAGEGPWWGVSGHPGAPPSAAAMRARFSATLGGASPEPGPPLRLA